MKFPTNDYTSYFWIFGIDNEYTVTLASKGTFVKVFNIEERGIVDQRQYTRPFWASWFMLLINSSSLFL